MFLYHCILRFLQIKSVQVCAPQNAVDSLKKSPQLEQQRIELIHFFF